MAESTLRTLILPVADLDAAITFYCTALGLPLKFRDGDHYAALDAGGITLALATDVDHPLAGEVLSGFRTSSVSKEVTDLVAAGAELVRQPHQGGHEVRAVLRDPAGNGFVIYGDA